MNKFIIEREEEEEGRRRHKETEDKNVNRINEKGAAQEDFAAGLFASSRGDELAELLDAMLA